MTSQALRVAALYRYPVKSLAGEPCASVDVDERGVRGDRLWSVRDPDGKLGSGKSTRRFRRMDGLLELSATYDGHTPVVTFPDGRSLAGDDPSVHRALSDHVGREVTLAREESVSHFDEGPLHLVTTSALRLLGDAHGATVDARRARPNLVVASGDAPGMVEEGWVGRRLAVGDAVVLEVRAPMPRCVMVTMAQVGLDADPGLLGTVTDLFDMCLGVVLDVVSPGPVHVGDAVRLL